jgi:hypothetical protein
MRFKTLGPVSGVVAGLALLFAGAAQAAMVSVSDVSVVSSSPDGVGGFSGATAAGDLVTVGVSSFSAAAPNTGAASGADYVYSTIAFKLTAEAGYWITGFTFTEQVAVSVDQSKGFAGAIASGSLVANGQSSSFGENSYFSPTSQTLTIKVIDILVPPASEVTVVITNNLTAFSGGGSASVAKNEAPTLKVTLSEIPLPPTLWMLGSAIAALAVVARRRGAARHSVSA